MEKKTDNLYFPIPIILKLKNESQMKKRDKILFIMIFTLLSTALLQLMSSMIEIEIVGNSVINNLLIRIPALMVFLYLYVTIWNFIIIKKHGHPQEIVNRNEGK